MHRFLAECPVGLEIDHVNQDSFDNRKQNLRCVDRITNIRNKKIKENQNIYWNNRQNKYQVSVRIENKNISGGYFSDIEEARKKQRKWGKNILNQAEFLGIIKSSEALTEWFINDT